MYQVRFHLGAGENYLKWQVRHGKDITYHSPDDVTLRMTGCKLRNFPGLAKRINAGAKKTVCAWVECEILDVQPQGVIQEGTAVQYNPRRVPYWTNEAGENLDNKKFETIISDGRKLLAA